MTAILPLLVLAAAPAAPTDAQLTVKQWRLLHEAVFAYQAGLHGVFLEKVTPLLSRGEPVVAAVEQQLSQARLPTIDEMLVESRVALSRNRDAPRVPVRIAEARRTIPYLQANLEKTLADLERARVLNPDGAGPRDMGRLEDMFWELHVLEQSIEDADRTSQLLPALVRGLSRRDLAELAPQGGPSPLDKYRVALDRLRKLQERVPVRDAELRYHRLEVALDVLHEEQVSPERILAAASWRSDLRSLEEYFANSSRPELGAALDAESIQLPEARRRAKEAEQLAGGLTDKAETLLQGLSSWTRGRYGAGPFAGGLVKSPLALSDPEKSLEVWMPETLPDPHDPLNGPIESAQPIPRRHFYMWSVHDGLGTDLSPLDASLSADPSEVVRFPGCSLMPPQGDTNRFRERQAELSARTSLMLRGLARPDSAMLPRLVGHLEYGLALACFDEVYRAASPDELAAMDELVASLPAFKIHTNLSRGFGLDQASAFREPAFESESDDGEDDFVRRGLAWVSALARVELGCMWAAWSKDEFPYQRFAPVNFDRDAYAELLVDALRWHHWSLRSDPVMLNIKVAPLWEPDALAYDRRIRMSRKLILAVRELFGPGLNPAQVSEIQQLDRHLAQSQMVLRSYKLKLGTGRLRGLTEERTIDEIMRDER